MQGKEITDNVFLRQRSFSVTAIGTEYVVAAKPLYWGGGRYVQIKAYLHEKMLICTVDVRKIE